MALTYRTITEVLDFGPHITKIILETGVPLRGAKLNPAQFTVAVERVSKLGADFEWPKFMGEKPDDSMKGTREIEALYVSDESGEPAADGSCITLCMACSPMAGIGSIIRFDGVFNVFVDVRYVITQSAPIGTADGTLTGLVFDADGGNRIVYGEWLQTGAFSHPDSDLLYAHYEPAHADGERLPLVIWLHGAGEGGQSPLIAAIGNKVVNFLSPEFQAFFGGRAALLAPQAPTMWMDDGTGQYTKDGSSMYVNALDALIDAYIEARPWIDRSRVYIGGCSNGGFMTMKMLIHTPWRYAAAFPICEALSDADITDAQIASIAQKPIWFTHAKTDTTVPPEETVVPTYMRLLAAGGQNIHFTFWDKVADRSGRYSTPDGEPFEYYGHWSWIYMLNNDCALDYDGMPVTENGRPVHIVEWLAAQKLKAE
ncbi:MAG: prolyl oligopeptidase family serine peptidase [Hominenteromicrobium sp.]